MSESTKTEGNLQTKQKATIVIIIIASAVFFSWFFLFNDCAICRLWKTSEEYSSISVDEAHSRVYNTTGIANFTLILDVRTLEEYNEGHIENATLFPVDDIENNIADILIYQHVDILVYCRSGRRSALASSTLTSYNFTIIYNMLGGFNDWVATGYPIEY